VPVSAKKKTVSSALKASRSSPSPLAGEGRGGGSASRGGPRVHKPHLDELHGPESLPFHDNPTLPTKPFGSSSRIILPTGSRQSGGLIWTIAAIERRSTGETGWVEEEVNS
jgi:excinuclease ABC subunit B